MIDLSAIPDAEKIKRGEDTILYFAHKDALEALQEHCKVLSVICSKVLSSVQQEPGSVGAKLIDAQAKLDEIKESAAMVESLAKQRAEWKTKAWEKS